MRVLLLVVAIAAPRPASAQPADGVRVGVTVGGSGLLGVSVEVLGRQRAVELTVGTFSFGELGVALSAREMFGASAFRPTVGAGLWLVTAPAHPEDVEAERSGMILLAQFPVGFDWRMTGRQYVTFDVNVTRGLWVRRPAPGDERPVNTRLVPIPELGYRWRF